MTRCNNYHHGDLRNALIMAAVALIEESGSEDFAMADAARRAGVSAAAPYRHFRDRNALLDAISDLYLIGLDKATVTTREAHPDGSRDCIIALGHTYSEYVLSRWAFYNLVWNREKSLENAPEEQASRPGFETFIGAVECWCKRQSVTETDPLDLGMKLWALVHGLTVLQMNGQLQHFMPGAVVNDMLTSSASALLDGVEQPPGSHGRARNKTGGRGPL